MSDFQTLRVNDYDMAYIEAGSGAPLVLVHGSLSDYRYWRPQMQPLSARRRVIAVSLRHYWPEDWEGRGDKFSPQQHADDLAGFLQELGAGPVDLVGHSRGGTVAYLAAQRNPDYVRTLTLAEPGIVTDDGQNNASAALDREGFRGRALDMIRRGKRDEGLALFIDTVSGKGTWSRIVPWIKQMNQDNAATLIGQVAEREVQVYEEALQALRMPLLLIGGANSPQPYPAVLDTLKSWSPTARRVTLPAASHAMNLWNAVAFNTALEPFLAKS